MINELVEALSYGLPIIIFLIIFGLVMEIVKKVIRMYEQYDRYDIEKELLKNNKRTIEIIKENGVKEATFRE